jgi:hypothetical protein
MPILEVECGGSALVVQTIREDRKKTHGDQLAIQTTHS